MVRFRRRAAIYFGVVSLLVLVYTFVYMYGMAAYEGHEHTFVEAL